LVGWFSRAVKKLLVWLSTSYGHVESSAIGAREIKIAVGWLLVPDGSDHELLVPMVPAVT
jgi:hypothetical protein